MNRRCVVVVFGALFGATLMVDTCQACRLREWFQRRRQVTAYSPQAGSCGPGYCQQTVVRYVPQVSYRTVYQPVPVTTYRRTSYANPQTGLPITCVRPCTTYTYQARRVPYTTYRPVYTTVPLTTAATPTTTANYAPAPNAGCNGCSTGFASSGYATPWYSTTPYASSAPSSSSYPSSPAASASPWRRVPESSQSYNGAETNDPGDRVPQVQPRIQNDENQPQAARPRQLSQAPSTSRQYASNDRYYRSNQRRDDASLAQNNQRSVLSRSTSEYEKERYEQDRNRSRSQDNDMVRNESVTGRQGYLKEPQPRVRPVPNIDPPSNRPLPRLLNFDDENDREASLIRPIPTRWAANDIKWGRVVHASYRRPVESTTSRGARSVASDDWHSQTNHTSHPSKASRLRDDGDWHSMRQR